ncbi:hypothetical protein KSX_38780 [Ktedonospora formicarum]|uniref:Uncharacterized protein n=1 Tax=Ktedonospora formicarum TaxID=2778364 RepID=A0A8J3MS51_9CHLR|nr:hypothetical protein KSX_38780 [Ktedonospora formicarum]
MNVTVVRLIFQGDHLATLPVLALTMRKEKISDVSINRVVNIIWYTLESNMRERERSA